MQAEADALKLRFEQEVDALRRKHDAAQAREAEAIKNQNKKLLKRQEEEDKKTERIQQKRLQELIKEETKKEEGEVAELHALIKIEEDNIALMTQKIKGKVTAKLKLQGEILQIAQDTVAAMEATDDAEATERRSVFY